MTEPFVPLKPAALARFGLVYIASPYSKYPHGLERAFEDVCEIAARFMRAGVHVFAPIAHSHPVAVVGGLDGLDHEFWLKQDFAVLNHSDALVIAEMEGWRESYGIRQEIEWFAPKGRPIFIFDPLLEEVRPYDGH